MSSLVLGTIGAFLGGMFGMPEVGWMIGSSLGAAIDAPTIKNEGPRVSDLKVQTSTWGKMIPIVYGSMRIAGNVIWSTDIQETKHVDSAKGGPQVETTTYTYSVNFAVSLCEGQIFGIRRIWAYGQLIFDQDPNATPETLLANNLNNVKFYSGTQTQLPDPTIEADKGIGNVPAYRGQAYVVFTDFQLADFGNRIPNLEFEVVQSGTTLGFRSLLRSTLPFNYFTGGASYTNRGSPMALGVEEGILRITSREFTGNVDIFDANAKFLGIEARRIDELYNGSFTELVGFTQDYVFIIRKVTQVPPWLGQNTSPLEVLRNGRLFRPPEIPANEYVTGVLLSPDKAIIMIFTGGSSGSYVRSLNWYQFTVDGVFYRSGLVDLAPLENIQFGTGYDQGGSYVGTAGGAAALESDYVHMWTVLSSASYLWEITSAGLLTRIQSLNSGSFSTLSLGYSNCSLYADNGLCYEIYGNRIQIWTRNPTVLPLPVPLNQIVLDQCKRGNIDTSKINVSPLTDSVSGFAITRQSQPRVNLLQLQKAFFFDAAESEGTIKFVKRGGAPVATIPFDDLAAHQQGGEPPDPVVITRMQEVDLPLSVSINFLHIDADYQVGSETSRRLITSSNQQVSEELAIAMTADKAAQVAEVLIYDAHVARSAFTFQTSRKYANLEPTDVVLLQTPSTSYRTRLVKKDDSSSLIKWQAVADDASVYTSTAVGGSQQVSQQQIVSRGLTRSVFMDIPLLQDLDDNAGMYVAMSGYTAAWGGATLYRSNDNLSFLAVDSVQNGAVIGLAQTVLGTWTGGNIPDESSTVTVTIITGTLASKTLDDLLQGANVALLGNEIIQYRTATLIAANQYRLSGLLRGRLGTEQYLGTHVINERFVVLGFAGTLRVNEGASAINAPRSYKAVSFGGRLAQAGAYAFTNTAVGLKPYAPVHIFGNRQTNNDWTLRWVRRTRVDGNWRDSVDAALGEATESYEIEIMQGVTVKRTLTATTPIVTYTSAQQVTDFGSNQATITFKIYQISATVGRGFPATRTL